MMGRLRVFLLIAVVAAAGRSGRAQETSVTPETAGQVDVTRFDEIPARFGQRQDSLGFFWQADQYGALTSGQTQYLASGLRFAIGEEDFAPVEAILTKGDSDELVLRESRPALGIERSLWFDLERGGVRVMDTITNRGTTALELPAEFRTTYPFAWQNLFGSRGSLLENRANPVLGDRDFGLTVKFSSSDGRPDTLILAGSENGRIKPEISASANLRELRLRYDVSLPAGESRTFVHWILQRNLRAASEAEGQWRPFYQRRRLVAPRIPASLVDGVVNLDPRSIARKAVDPANLANLFALAAVLEKAGVRRGEKDILWMSEANQLTGRVSPEVVRIRSERFGERQIPLAEIAALEGMKGPSEAPRVFLRDGRVVAGMWEADDLHLTVEGDRHGERFEADSLALLVCGLDARDGTPPAGSAALVALRGGDVVAVSTGDPGSEGLGAIHPWGSEEIEWKDLEELAYQDRPIPSYRVAFRDGSRLNLFLSRSDVVLPRAGDSPASVPSHAILRVRSVLPGARRIVTAADDWFAFSDLPVEVTPPPGFLLKGRNLVAGKFREETLQLLDGDVVVEVPSAEVVSLRRQEGDTGEPGGAPFFEWELAGGEWLTGSFARSEFVLQRGETVWMVPVEHLHAYRGSIPPDPKP